MRIINCFSWARGKGNQVRERREEREKREKKKNVSRWFGFFEIEFIPFSLF